MNQNVIDAISVHDDKNIKGFFGPYRWLSNFHLVEITYEGITYPSTENAYQASKFRDGEEELELKHSFSAISPASAKKTSKLIPIRPDWDDIKLKVMEDLNRLKYQNPVCCRLLIDTGDKYLEETNWWNDKFWGVCRGEGENHLGKIIMKIREEIKNG